MLRQSLFLTVTLFLLWIQGSTSTPIYGFNGASAVLLSGRTLHYLVRLETCKLVESTAILPEYTKPFGSHVTTWRTFNDREIAEIPFLVFFEQKMILNNTGGLVHLSREVEVWQNDTAIIRTIVYSPDFDTIKNHYEHQCTLSSEETKGNIDFEGSSTEPVRLNSFSDIIESMEAGMYVHFSAMTFICQGGREHTFSNFGGRIPNYELKEASGEVTEIKSSVQQTVHYDKRSDTHVIDVINLRLYDNRTVEIVDTRGRPNLQELVHQHVSYCFIAKAGAHGGTFSLYA